MKELQFDSIYKFIVSIGITIFLLPVGIFTLIFKDEKIIYVKNEELLKLSESSQNIIKIRQNLMLKSINSFASLITCLVLVGVGICIILYGLYKWNNVQKQIDEKSRLENKKLENEIEKMTDKEKFNSIKNEVSNGINQNLNTQSYINFSSHINKYLKVERTLAKVITKSSTNHQIIINSKIGKYEYDIIAKGKGFLTRDYIFEIKYISSITDKWLVQVIEKINKAYKNYIENTNRIPYRKLIIVTDKENFEEVNKIVLFHPKMNKFSIEVILRDSINEYSPNI